MQEQQKSKAKDTKALESTKCVAKNYKYWKWYELTQNLSLKGHITAECESKDPEQEYN